MGEEEPLARAARASLERIARDRERVSGVVRRLLDEIADHFLDLGYGVEDLKRACGDDPEEPLAAFAAELGSPVTYMAEARLATAMRLLLQTEWTVGRISEEVGYAEPSRFSNACTRRFGVTPNQYRREARRSSARPAGRPAVEELCFAAEAVSPVPEAERSLMVESMAEGFRGYLAGRTAETQLALLQTKLLFAGPELFEVLSRESRKAGRRDRRLGVRIAEVALAAVESSRALLGERYADLHALALARLANALRLAGDLAAAEEVFERPAIASPSASAGRKGEIEAEILALRGSLRLFQRRFSEARELFGSAIALAERVNDLAMQVKVRLQRAALEGYEGRLSAMIPDLRAVVPLVASQKEPDRLTLLGVYQELTLAYVETGEIHRAEAQLPRAKALCQELDHQASSHQLQWIDGLIAKARNEPRRAERFFRQAKAGFDEIGDNDGGAMAALDIAILCQAEGRSAEVVALITTEVIPVLETLELRRETLGAVTLLRRAVAENEVTADVLEAARDALRAIQRDPARSRRQGPS